MQIIIWTQPLLLLVPHSYSLVSGSAVVVVVVAPNLKLNTWLDDGAYKYRVLGAPQILHSDTKVFQFAAQLLLITMLHFRVKNRKAEHMVYCLFMTLVLNIVHPFAPKKHQKLFKQSETDSSNSLIF